MDINCRICCDYDYENNNMFGPHQDVINRNDMVIKPESKIDINTRLEQRRILLNKYKPENINRNTVIELFDNDNIDEIKKLLTLHWQSSDVNNLLFEYCIKQNDIDILERIITKDNNVNLFGDNNERTILNNMFVQMQEKFSLSDTIKNLNLNDIGTNNSRKYVNPLIDLDRLDMCKFILTHTQVSPEIISEFFCCIISTQKTNFLDVFASHGHKMSNLQIQSSIMRNYLDVVKYAIANNYDVQLVFDECIFYYKDGHSTYDMPQNVQMLQLLVDHQINISEKILDLSLNGAKHGSLELIEYCYKHNSSIDINAVLLVACLNNKENVIKFTLELGADINSISAGDLIDTNLNTIKLCLKYNMQIDFNTINHIFAKYFLYEEITDLIILISYGADSNCIFDQENKFEHSLLNMIEHIIYKKYHLLNSKLEYIVSMGKISHIKYLADTCFDKLQPELNRLFVVASANGKDDMVNYLLDLGADIHTGDDMAFASACFFGHFDTVKLLLDRGVDITMITRDVCLLSVYGCISTGKFIGYGMLIEGNDTIFRNDLFNFGKNHLDIFKLLMENNVPVLSSDIFSILPRTHCNNYILMYILSHCADIDLDNALNTCIVQKNITVTKFLLDHGANANSISFCENDEIKKLLIEYGFNEEK